jgi:hypothetical protein
MGTYNPVMVWRKQSWKGIHQEGGRGGDKKGDGFRISQTNCKWVHRIRDILLMTERSSEGFAREQSSVWDMLLNECSSEGLSREQSSVWDILLNRCMTWMLKVPWTAKKSNEVILQLANEQRPVFRDVIKRQSKFICHILGKGGIEHAVTTVKIVGKKNRGRQREKIWDGLTNWMRMRSNADLMTKTRDRNMWRFMIANDCQQSI